jgi:hypothetical protein
MKPLDFLLLSFAIGLTAFTVYVLGAEDIGAAALPDGAPRSPVNPAFRAIVLHHSATHAGSAGAFDRNHRVRLGGLAYHFVIGNGAGTADGFVETGYRWRDQVPGPHTKNNDVNRASVAVCLVGDLESRPPTLKQLRSLIDLLARLSRELNVRAHRILSHGEVDAETLCPGRGLPMEEIRGAVARRLAPEAPGR